MVKLFARDFFLPATFWVMRRFRRLTRKGPENEWGIGPAMEKHILILTTTKDFLWKFEGENVKTLQHLGYVVHYAANMNEPAYIADNRRLRQMGVRIHHIDIARSPFLFQENQKALQQVVELIRRYHIQALHCHTPVGGLLGRLAGKQCADDGVVVIYTAHGFHFYKGAPLLNQLVYYRVEKYLARYTDILIVINEEDYRSALKLHLKKGGQIYKIPGVGLDGNKFHPLTEEEYRSCRKALGIGPRDFFLVSVGELNGNKNHRIVLEALAQIRRSGNVSLIRYGVCGDGFFRKRMEDWIGELGLADIVTLYGYRDDIPAVLGCADASIFPSKREGLGMAGLESLAMGVPVIAADNRGTREYMEHEKNGFVYRCDDAAGFAEGIRMMMSLTSAQRAEMKLRCLDAVKPFRKAYACAVMRRIYTAVTRRIEEADQYG